MLTRKPPESSRDDGANTAAAKAKPATAANALTIHQHTRPRRYLICATLMAEIDRHRAAAGMSQEGFSEFYGGADRAFAKALHAHAPSGRQPNWSTLDLMLAALCPDGYLITITPIPGPNRSRLRDRYERMFSKKIPVRAESARLRRQNAKDRP